MPWAAAGAPPFNLVCALRLVLSLKENMTIQYSAVPSETHRRSGLFQLCRRMLLQLYWLRSIAVFSMLNNELYACPVAQPKKTCDPAVSVCAGVTCRARWQWYASLTGPLGKAWAVMAAGAESQTAVFHPKVVSSVLLP